MAAKQCERECERKQSKARGRNECKRIYTENLDCVYDGEVKRRRTGGMAHKELIYVAFIVIINGDSDGDGGEKLTPKVIISFAFKTISELIL